MDHLTVMAATRWRLMAAVESRGGVEVNLSETLQQISYFESGVREMDGIINGITCIRNQVPNRAIKYLSWLKEMRI